MDFTTSRLADILFARRKAAAGRAVAAEFCEGLKRRNLLQSGEARVPLSLVFPSLSESPSVSCEPGCLCCQSLTQHSQHSRGAGAPAARLGAAGGSSSGRARTAAPIPASVWLCPFIASPRVPVPTQLPACYSLWNSLKIHLGLRKTAEDKLLSRPCSPKARNVHRQVLQNMMSKNPLPYAFT